MAIMRMTGSRSWLQFSTLAVLVGMTISKLLVLEIPAFNTNDVRFSSSMIIPSHCHHNHTFLSDLFTFWTTKIFNGFLKSHKSSWTG
jgi:hypothetical protein